MKTQTTTPPGFIGRYQIHELVGRGAMGEVFRAVDPLIGRAVAIKRVSAALAAGAGSAEFRTRFFREAKAAGNLRHPNIVTIFDLGEEDGTPFMAQEFVEGESLGTKVRREGRLSPAEAAGIVRQVAQGLGFAHQRGVVHRDIKPDNILIDSQGRAVITDFGIARLDNSEVTRTGEILGTPHYMSPEQVLGKELDGRSDLFSLGVVFYQLLTGAKPFTGPTPTAVCCQIVHAAPPRWVLEGGVTHHLRGIIERLLQKDPEQRFATAEELIRALEGKKWSTIPLPSSTLRIRPPVDRAWRRWRWILSGGAFLLALAAVAAGVVLSGRPAARARPAAENRPPPPVPAAPGRPGKLGLIVSCPFPQCALALDLDGETKWRRTFEGGFRPARRHREPPVFVELPWGDHDLRLEMRGPRREALPPLERRVNIEPGKTGLFLIGVRRHPPGLTLTPLPARPESPSS